MSPPMPSPCDGFAEAIVLRGDRELGAAESAALEAHLEACPACRARARREETLSAVLKHWDAETAQPVSPPARLAGAIFAEIEETSRHRRAEERFYRVLRYAQVACVALSLATAVLLGVRQGGGDGARTEGGPSGVARPAPLDVSRASVAPPSHGPSDRPSGVPFRPGSGSLAMPALPAVPTGLETLGAEALARAEDVLVPVVARELLERRFAERYGEPGVWFAIPDGPEVLLTATAARYVTDAELFPRLERKAAGHQYAPFERRRGMGRRVGEVLPFPAEEPDLVAWLPRLTWDTVASPPLRVAEIPPATAPGVSRGVFEGPVLDSMEAVKAGVLTFEEGESDGEVIALSKGNRAPIFLPAGEILVGGERDRVVSRSLWIPAAAASGEPVRRADLIPCAVVSTARSRRGEHPAPLGVVAGPGLRALLAREATPQRVLQVVRAQLALKGFHGADLSLVDLYAQASVREAAASADRTFPRALAGIAVVDVDGRLLGVETTSIGDREGATLLGRLLIGYLVEGQLRDIQRARGGGSSATAPTSDVLPVLATLLAEARPLETVSDEGEVRVSRLAAALDDVVVESVEVGGRPAFTAVLRPW